MAVACGTDDDSNDLDMPVVEDGFAGESPPPADADMLTPPEGVSAVEAIAEVLPFDFDISVYQGESALGAGTVRFSEVVARGKPVVLNMWAGLCPPCRAEMPDLEEVHQQFGDHIVLLGLDVGLFTGLGNKDDALDLINEIGITYPAGSTPQAKVISAYKVLGMPSTYFIKPDGSVMKKWTGALNQAKLTELVEQLIAAS